VSILFTLKFSYLTNKQMDAEDVSGTVVTEDNSGFVFPFQDMSGIEHYLYDVDRLLEERDQLLQKEAADRARVDTIESPDTTTLAAKLSEWAIKGFPGGFPIFSITLDPPTVCIDGIQRGLFDYVAYLAGMPIGDKMQRLTNKLKGMYVQCSYSGNTITFHVFKDVPSYTGVTPEDTEQDSTSTQDIPLPPDAPEPTEPEYTA
jgi:hypothetical protein